MSTPYDEPLQRIDNAVQIALEMGMIDGSHHKQWVIDQMIRRLLADDYEPTMKIYNEDIDYDEWDVGIAP